MPDALNGMQITPCKCAWKHFTLTFRKSIAFSSCCQQLFIPVTNHQSKKRFAKKSHPWRLMNSSPKATKRGLSGTRFNQLGAVGASGIAYPETDALFRGTTEYLSKQWCYFWNLKRLSLSSAGSVFGVELESCWCRREGFVFRLCQCELSCW